MKVILVAALVSSVAGCNLILGEPRSTTTGAAPAQPSPKLESNSVVGKSASPTPAAATSPAEEDEPTKAIRARAAAVQKMAVEAVHIEGSDEAVQVSTRSVSECSKSMNKRRECVAWAKDLAAGDGKHVGTMAALAIVLTSDVRPTSTSAQVLALEENVKNAETLAQVALDEAKDLAAGRASIEAERGAIEAAKAECTANAGTCKTRCDAGDGSHCVARAEQLRKASKFVEAKAVVAKACEKKIHTACLLGDQIDDDIAATGAKNDALWSEVQEVADDLARKQHQIEMVSKLANTQRLQVSAQRMRTIGAAIVTEKYCPARKNFVAHAGLAAFQKRASAHCKDDPPSASGLSGAQITLTAKCQGSFATACP